MDPMGVIKHAFWGKPMLCDVFNLDVLKPLKLVSTLVPPRIYHLDVPDRKLGSMVIGSMGYFTDPYKWRFCWGCNPLILTFDPNFQRDIQAGSSNLIHKKHNVAFSREEPSIMALKVFCGGMALLDGEGLKHIFFVTWNIESVRVSASDLQRGIHSGKLT